MRFESLAAGFHSNALDRYRTVAFFVDQVTEAYPPRGLAMRRLIDERESGRGIEYIASLRILEAHAGEALRDDQQDVIRRFNRLTSAEKRGAVTAGIQHLGEAMGLQSLPALLTPFLED